MQSTDPTYDVAILGGGLAGLSLALQLRDTLPRARIAVLERRTHPVPEAAYKVGESTVEIGAHYLSEILHLREHLERDQLRKFGIRLFFNAGYQADLSEAVELGAQQRLTVPSYQLDRGILENHLGQLLLQRGVRFIDRATVRKVVLDSSDGHRVTYRHGDADHELTARWVVDAQSRASLIRRQLNLAETNGHHANAVWFRIARRLDVAQWTSDPAWHARCPDVPRWLSTNHLMGPGYWVWLIPLASGSTSVGIVADPRLHPLEELKTFDHALDWLQRHQPRCAAAVRAHRDQLQDFMFLKDYSHGCRQVFSSRRWALTGEAGVFLDPFYSPGSDFIGISNTYITDLIRRDLDGERIQPRVRLYERLYLSFYRSTLALYEDQYPMFGQPRIMSFKVFWDYAYYWGVLALLFFQQRLTDGALLARHGVALQRMSALNDEMQALLRAWAAEENGDHYRGVFVNQNRLPVMVRLNRELAEMLDEAGMDSRLQANFELLEKLAGELRALAPAALRDAVTLYQAPAGTPVLDGMPTAFLRPGHA